MSVLPEVMTAAQLAEFLQTTSEALAQDRYRGRGIPFVKVGARVRYLPAVGSGSKTSTSRPSNPARSATTPVGRWNSVPRWCRRGECTCSPPRWSADVISYTVSTG